MRTNKSGYIGKVNKYESERGDIIEENLFSNTGEVLAYLKKIYKDKLTGVSNASDLFRELHKFGIMECNYDAECFEIKYDSWYVTEEYDFLINDIYLKPYGGGFQWSHKGIAWIKEFLAEEYKEESIQLEMSDASNI